MYELSHKNRNTKQLALNNLYSKDSADSTVVDGGCIVCSLRISQATERLLYIHRRLLAG